MTALNVADLVVIGGRVLGIGTGAALERVDPRAAETALAEAPALLSLPDSYAAAAACAHLMNGLLQHPPFPGHRERIAVAVGLQFLAVNGWRADLGPPQAAALAVQCLASGRVEPDEMAGWLAARLSVPTARGIRMPHIRSDGSLVRLSRHRPDRRAGDGAGMSIDGRMLARFSDHAAAAVFMARQEARRLGHGSVDPEHLLLGLIRVGEGTGISVLDRLEVSRETLRGQLEERIGHGPGRTCGPVRFSRPRGQKVLSSALPEAFAHGTTDICTAHLLLAQYHDDGPASRTLTRLGASEGRVRDTVAALRT
ncbi:MAG TPA: Clp protease N-terminal domain-containing protein [Streptosporangiaceae bacterium]|nr:Clp protease N-terminal domain-containing protein [Streptosporangiaceae bacterium]